MMRQSEHDLELLETLLDGELSEEEAEMLRRRVSSEPELARAVDLIRADRAARERIWRSMEPQETQVADFMTRFARAVRKHEVWTTRLHALRYASGLAACILLGFLIGRFNAPMIGNDRGGGVVFEPGSGALQEVVDSRHPVRTAGGGYKVLLTDSFGRVIAEQPFTTFDEAREFTDDLRRLQSQNRTRPVRVSDTIFTKDQF